MKRILIAFLKAFGVALSAILAIIVLAIISALLLECYVFIGFSNETAFVFMALSLVFVGLFILAFCLILKSE